MASRKSGGKSAGKSGKKKSSGKSRGKSTTKRAGSSSKAKSRSKSKSSTAKRRTTTRAASSSSRSRSAGKSAGKSSSGGGGRGKSGRSSAGGKVGTSRRAAGKVGGKGDFGVRNAQRTASEAGSSDVRQRQAREDRVGNQLGRELPRAGVDSREAGVGGHEAGPGSYSGGDLDTSVSGVGFGNVAESGPDDVNTLGESETTGGSEEFASGPPARGANQGGRRGRVGGSKQVRGGTTHDRSGDDTATGDASADRDAGRRGSGNTGVGFTHAESIATRDDASDADIEDVSAGGAAGDDNLDVEAGDDDDANADDDEG